MHTDTEQYSARIDAPECFTNKGMTIKLPQTK